MASAVSEILDHYRCNGLIEVEITELEEESYKQETPGRPGKDTRYIRSTSNRFKINNRIEEAAVGRDATTDGVFALVSNDRDLSDPEVLKAYKKQPKVEKRFSQFKSDYEVAPVYLKNVARIEALMCTYFLALLTESLIEREMRLAMVAEASIRSPCILKVARANDRALGGSWTSSGISNATS